MKFPPKETHAHVFVRLVPSTRVIPDPHVTLILGSILENYNQTQEHCDGSTVRF